MAMLAMIGADVKRSTDGGLTWATVLSPLSGSNIGDMRPTAAGWMALIFGGTDAGVWRSQDGSTWSRVSTDAGSVWVGATSGSTWINSEWGSALRRTTDGGTTWADVTIDPDDSLDVVGYGNGVWITAGYNGLHRSIDDGATWAQVATLDGSEAYRVKYADGVWLLANGFGIHRSTDDGATWTSQRFPVYEYENPGNTDPSNIWYPKWWDLTHAGGVWFACGDVVAGFSAFAAAASMYSTDGGATWTRVTLPDGLVRLTSAAFAGGSWRATSQQAHPAGPYVGYAAILSSPDAITWAVAYAFPDPNDSPRLLTTPTGAAPTGALHVYDPATDTWTKLADGPAVSHAGSVVLGGLLYVLGGRGADGMYSPELHAYDPATDTWAAKASALGRISDPAVTAANGKLYVLGGEQQIDTVYQPMQTVWIYDPAGDTWSTSQDLTVPHTAAGACEIGSILYAAGGVADGYHAHEAAVDGDAGTDDLYSDELTVWMAPPAPLSTFSDSGGGGWAPLPV